MGFLDPYPDPDCESGSRRAKMTHKHRKKLINFMDAGCSLLRAEGFSSSLDIRKLQFFIRKRFLKISAVFFFLLTLVIKTLD
jgi:hypothetical protein